MALNLYIGREMDKPFIEELVRHCISKEIVPISEDTVVSLDHFNKVLKVTDALQIFVPKIEIEGFVFYVKNATDEPISVSPQDCTLEGGYDPIVVMPNSTVHLSTDATGNYVLLSNSAENNPAGPFFKVLEHAFVAMKPSFSGDTFDVVLPYTVGSNGLSIYSRGTEWYRSFEFEEIGPIGKKSHTIKLLSDVAIGDEMLIRVIDSSEHHIHEVNFIAEENLPSGSVYILPRDLQYHVGSYAVKVSVRGTEWYRTMDFEEVGAFNQISNMILLLDDIYAGDEVCIRTIDVGPVCVMAGSSITDIKTEVIMSNMLKYIGIIPSGSNTIDMPEEIDPVTMNISIYLQGVYQLTSSWYIENNKIVFSEELKTFTEDIEYEIVAYYNNKDKVYVDAGAMIDSSVIYLTKHCTVEENYIEVYISGVKQTSAGWTLRGNSVVLNKAIKGAIEYEVLIYPANVVECHTGIFTEDSTIIKLPKEYDLKDWYLELFISGLHQRSDTYSLLGDTITLVRNAEKNFIYDIVFYPKIGVQKTGVIGGGGSGDGSCGCADKLTLMQDDITRIGNRVQTLEVKVDNLSTTMDTLKEQMKNMDGVNSEKIQELENAIASKPTHEEFEELTGRVDTLETTTTDLKSGLETLQEQIGDVSAEQIANIEEQLANLESAEWVVDIKGRLETVENLLNNLDDNLKETETIKNLSKDLTDMSNKLTNLETNMPSQEQVNTISSKVDDLEGQLKSYIAGSSTNINSDVGTPEFDEKFENLNEGEFITVSLPKQP